MAMLAHARAGCEGTALRVPLEMMHRVRVSVLEKTLLRLMPGHDAEYRKVMEEARPACHDWWLAWILGNP